MMKKEDDGIIAKSLIYRKDNTNKNIKTIEDYILSQEGQDITKEIGYVPINN